MITENLSTLKIHKLTQAQYERERDAGKLDPTALYLTPDDGNGPALPGSVSWNDLKDKPFGEETIVLGDTITWDGTPSEYSVALAYVSMEHVSNSTPTADELKSAVLVWHRNTGTESEFTPSSIVPNGSLIMLLDGSDPIVVVAPTDGAEGDYNGVTFSFPKSGIYFLRTSATDYTKSLKVEGYNFTGTIVNGIDPKYLPQGGFGYIEDPTIFPETVLNGVSDAPKVYLFPLDFKIEVGEAYDVTIDGVTTTCVAKVLSPNETPPTIILGNARVFTTNFDDEDTGEDFCIADRFFTLEYNVLVSSTKAYPETVTVSIKRGVGKVHKIDSKFLPDTVATKADIQAYIDEAILNGAW